MRTSQEQEQGTSYTLLMEGFDVDIQNSEVGDGFYNAVVSEHGNAVYYT
jgi:hypothetical protein